MITEDDIKKVAMKLAELHKFEYEEPMTYGDLFRLLEFLITKKQLESE